MIILTNDTANNVLIIVWVTITTCYCIVEYEYGKVPQPAAPTQVTKEREHSQGQQMQIQYQGHQQPNLGGGANALKHQQGHKTWNPVDPLLAGISYGSPFNIFVLTYTETYGAYHTAVKTLNSRPTQERGERV